MTCIESFGKKKKCFLCSEENECLNDLEKKKFRKKNIQTIKLKPVECIKGMDLH